MSDSQTSALPTLVSAALVVLARMGITGYESAMHFHTSVALFMLVPLFGILFPAFPPGKPIAAQLKCQLLEPEPWGEQPDRRNDCFSLCKQQRTVDSAPVYAPRWVPGVFLFPAYYPCTSDDSEFPVGISSLLLCGLGSADTPHSQAHHSIHLPGHRDFH